MNKENKICECGGIKNDHEDYVGECSGHDCDCKQFKPNSPTKSEGVARLSRQRDTLDSPSPSGDAKMIQEKVLEEVLKERTLPVSLIEIRVGQAISRTIELKEKEFDFERKQIINQWEEFCKLKDIKWKKAIEEVSEYCLTHHYNFDHLDEFLNVFKKELLKRMEAKE